MEEPLTTVVALAAELIRVRTAGACEAAAADVIEPLLKAAGFSIRRSELAPGRHTLDALLPGHHDRPLVATGHLDTVPVPDEAWEQDPFGGAVTNGLLHGRGAVDTKGGVAALVVAAIRFAATGSPRGLRLLLTAGEETGCLGATAHLAQVGVRDARALLVAEPTGCEPLIGHKGVVWLRVTAKGRAAHASRPELGDNAVDKLVRALARLGPDLDLGPSHSLIGGPSWSLGTIRGGHQTNLIPDTAEATIDVRIAPGLGTDRVVAAVRDQLADGVEVDVLRALPGVSTDPADSFASFVAEAVRKHGGQGVFGGASYFTDASVLAPALGDPPVVICGPGDPALAHARNERCSLEQLERAASIYLDVFAGDWSTQ